jgi:tetratricopeptide (TPR) repeat protein
MNRRTVLALTLALSASSAALSAHAHEPTDIADLSRRIHRAPGDVHLLILRADAYLRADMPERALADLRVVRTLHPSSPHAGYMLAMAYAASGALEQAEAELDATIGAGGGSLRTHRLRGRIRAELGRLEGAVEDYEAALAHGDDLEVYRALGRALVDIGRLDEAADALRSGVQAMVGSVVLRRDLIGVLRRLGRHAEALEQIDAIRAGARVDVEWMLLRADVLAEMGRAQEAEEARRRALAEAEARLARRPSALAHALRGEALLALGRVDEAGQEARAALRLAPESERAGALSRTVARSGGAR